MMGSKKCFEDFAACYQVSIRSIMADNGAYASHQFQEAYVLANQELTYCAVGGHWQNGVAEQHIGIVTQTA